MPEIKISTHKCRSIIDLATKYFADMPQNDKAQFKRFREWYKHNGTENLKEFWDSEAALTKAK